MMEVNEIRFIAGKRLVKGEDIEGFCSQDPYVKTFFDERSFPPFSGRGISRGGRKSGRGQNENTDGWVQ
jgi:hypothetical protein